MIRASFIAAGLSHVAPAPKPLPNGNAARLYFGKSQLRRNCGAHLLAQRLFLP
jgi:hypothetical protein